MMDILLRVESKYSTCRIFSSASPWAKKKNLKNKNKIKKKKKKEKKRKKDIEDILGVYKLYTAFSSQ